MSYTDDHRDALADVQEDGGPCPITKGATVINGYATPLEPAVNEYIGLGLGTKQNIKLFWVPVVRGALPEKTATFLWSGLKYAVAEPNPYDPDGNGAIYCELVGSR